MCKSYIKFEGKIQSIALVQFWPGNRCKGGHCAIPKTTPFVKEGFMLNGFWPQIRVNAKLRCCLFKLDLKRVENIIFRNRPLVEMIHKNWMSFQQCGYAMYQFDTHGTCAMQIYHGPRGVIEYMKTAIHLFNKYDAWEILKQSELKVQTNKLYKIQDLKVILQKVYGEEPVFFCQYRNLVRDFRICYDPRTNKENPHPIRCPEKFFQKEKEKCDEEILFELFPMELTKPETAPRNNCPY
ncbi:hypothetical protein EIN_294770 [Entamoeba invadens IP1]|uniref:Uncharacterized protein n=1 Tax=Entamoeba invadens IP1 TaxID=370355 RepID=L7FN52_ENTIV|nr:hypothetical protein EIN_294770 [Entamoeba invadens IP1]ELP90977.1 hypothetical protein EIN_294770 [Entamoeba invadens IP1]|eukprot:XP_004257748.1 hypothetical protein EIN_294770 [Entamoeba invadens IP1]